MIKATYVSTNKLEAWRKYRCTDDQRHVSAHSRALSSLTLRATLQQKITDHVSQAVRNARVNIMDHGGFEIVSPINAVVKK